MENNDNTNRKKRLETVQSNAGCLNLPNNEHLNLLKLNYAFIFDGIHPFVLLKPKPPDRQSTQTTRRCKTISLNI